MPEADLPINVCLQYNLLDSKQLLPFVREDTSGMDQLQVGSILLHTVNREEYTFLNTRKAF